MYENFLFAHSWLRWPVLFMAVVVALAGLQGWMSGAGWDGQRRRFGGWFLIVLNFEFVLGFFLYVVFSPVARAAWTNFGESMGDPVARYWAIEHAVTMLVAVLIANAGFAYFKAGTTAKNARGIAFVTIVYLAITLATMPWPTRDYGRELFRSYGM